MSKEDLNGWLIVDKPLGMTSAQVVGLVRRATGIKKVGHAGTLDPLASGVLPLALGEATKTVSYIQDTLKTYEFEITWGESRSTDDAEGEVIASSPVIPSLEAIKKIIPRFEGDIEQIPPAYSAIKVQGKRAYALARAGQKVDLKARTARIEKLEIVKTTDKTALLRLRCGKGTYVRSLARDMAIFLGTYGYVSSLRRTQVGQFCEKNSIECKKVLELGPQIVLQRAWYSISKALDDILAITLAPPQERLLRQGRAIEYPEREVIDQKALCLSNRNVPIAIVSVKEGRLAPERVFNID